MRIPTIGFALDPSVLVVWAAMLGVGGVAWLGSGTPIAGAAIVVAVLLATALHHPERCMRPLPRFR